jgi:NAD(P)-dependent dehydrogenase (short-subunit alcohol dehydrogenase family)
MMDEWRGAVVVVVSVSTPWSDPAAPNPAALGGHVGAICAADFAAHGGSVVAVDPDASALAALRDQVARSGGTLETIQAGLTDEAALRDAAEICAERYGRADVLVTGHTAIERRSIEHSDFDSWRRIVEENLLGPVFATKAFLPLLKNSGRRGAWRCCQSNANLSPLGRTSANPCRV